MSTSTHRAPHIVRWSVRHPWRALGVWVLFVVVAFGAAQLTGITELDQDQAGAGESGRAAKIVAAAGYPAEHATETVLIRRRDGGVLSDAQVTSVAASLRTALARVADVTKLDGAPTRSADGRAALLGWTIAGDRTTAPDRVGPMIAATQRVADAHPALEIGQAGEASLLKAMDDTIGKDFARAELLSLPITFILLIVVFGSLVAAFVPLAFALTAIVAAFGLTGVASGWINQSDGAGSVMLVIGIAVGVDYALFILRRARAERSAGMPVRDSILVASATSGHAVVVSGLTVMIAMAGMLLVGDPTFSSLGLGSMLVVGVAVLGALIALPALLALLGDRVDALRVPVLSRRRAARHGDSRFWGAVVRRSTRRPARTLVVFGGALALVAVPALTMRTELPYFGDLPQSIPEVRTYAAIETAFPTEGGVHEIVMSGTEMRAPGTETALADFARRVGRESGVPSGWRPVLDIAPSGRVARFSVPYRGDVNGPVAKRTLRELRTFIVPASIGTVADVAVGGVAAESADFRSLVRSRLPVVMAFVVGLTFLLMALTFRSFPVAIVTALLNILSVGAAYGLLVLVFQHHWLDGVLGITTTGAIVAWLPLFMFVVLFGLSMDYHVFVLSRIREAFLSGEIAQRAIAIGVRQTASVVTSAAVIMVAAFSIFATLSTIDMKQLGVGLAVAVAIDATLIRGILLPAALSVLGERAWREAPWARRLPGRRERARTLAPERAA